ncbi:MAG: Selenide, water dikinase [Clostridiales bacterium 38_11]|nr:MAG: Selenide, water dikinase [Clostridiales bacterium 38_11]
MAQVLSNIPVFEDKNLLVGLGKADDAAVYRAHDNLCVIQTLDFFTPIVDDPYTFGQIAAANALSDVYAMGGKPILALNIVGFPSCLSPDILSEILKGGADKVKEAKAVLAGGHSIEDDEPKYGMSVMGFVDCDKILTNSGAKAGDIILISKPLGSGIINTALKGDMADEKSYKSAVEVMTKLNDRASEAALEMHANACTDITGFGLLGHAVEMSENSDVTISFDMKSIPIIEGALNYASIGLIPGGAYKNRSFYMKSIKDNGYFNQIITDICFDPQTSGGLLISVPKDNINLLDRYPELVMIGNVSENKGYRIELL